MNDLRGQLALLRQTEQRLARAAAGTSATAVVLDVDSTIVLAHNEKEGAQATYKSTFGFHPFAGDLRQHQ